MSYEAVLEQVKSLPEECLEDAAKYIRFLKYQYIQDQMEPLVESDAVFEQKMRKGLDDVKTGFVAPVKETFAEIRSQFI